MSTIFWELHLNAFMLSGNTVRGLSTGEWLWVHNLEVSALHRDGTHRRRHHSRSQPLKLNKKLIHSNLKKNQSRERIKNRESLIFLWSEINAGIRWVSKCRENYFFMRADVLCFVVLRSTCLFYQDYNHLVRFHLKNILLCYPSMSVMIVVSSWKDDHLWQQIYFFILKYFYYNLMMSQRLLIWFPWLYSTI